MGLDSGSQRGMTKKVASFALRRLRPQVPQEFERVNPRMMAIAEFNRIRVVADRDHSINCQRTSLRGLDRRKKRCGFRRLKPRRLASGARARIPQVAYRNFLN